MYRSVKSLFDNIHNAVIETRALCGDIAEAGVFEGETALTICEAKEDKHLHLFDTFKGLPEVMFSDIDTKTPFSKIYVAPNMYSCPIEEVKEKLRGFPNVYYYKGIFPYTAEPVKNTRFSFVHLDLDLYKSTLEALKFFYPRLVNRGILISHNYDNLPGVAKAFDEYFPIDLVEKIGFSQGKVV